MNPISGDQPWQPTTALGDRFPHPQVWSVSGLCLAMAQTLQARFGTVDVQGEISGFLRAGSGHCYFNLKDQSGQLRCAMFKRHAALMDFAPKDGDLVRLRARLDLYSPRGDVQLVVEAIEKAGLGPLLERFLQLKARLQAKGLFDLTRKRALPPAPRAIGLVTSLGAAALRDVASALARRVPHIPVVLVNAKVQGAQAPEEIIQALEQLKAYVARDTPQGPSTSFAPVDVVLLVRGGGSIEDLWAFNDEALAWAITRFPVPVVTGIGHETDFTIADFVADMRAPTPTAAAELVTASLADRLGQLASLQQNLRRAVQRQIDLKEQMHDAASARLGRPSDVLHRQTQRIAGLAHLLSRHVNAHAARAHQKWLPLATQWPVAVQRYTQSRQQGLDRAQAALQHLDPKKVLTRGYAWLTDTQGSALTAAEQVTPGQQVQAHMADGTIDLIVTGRQLDGQ